MKEREALNKKLEDAKRKQALIDGILAATDTSYSYQYNQGFNRTSDLQMGVHLNGSAFPLIGRLKAFRMYNRRLNDAEIAALAAEFPHSAS